MLVFGESQVGCLKNNDDLGTSKNCLSDAECALRCLTKIGCKSFDYRPRQQDCRLSTQSFTACGSSCESQRWLDCRYYELRTEKTSSAATSVTASNNIGTSNMQFTYSKDMTPDLQLIF